MKTLVLILSFAGIGCASHGDLSKRTPSIQYQSSKAPAELASCISQKWMEIWNTTSTSPFNGGMVVSIGNQYGGSPGVAWIIPNESGSDLKFNSQIESYCPEKLCIPVKECQ